MNAADLRLNESLLVLEVVLEDRAVLCRKLHDQADRCDLPMLVKLAKDLLEGHDVLADLQLPEET
jgi:hypothetical protein